MAPRATLVVYGAVVLCADSAVTPPGFPNGELVALSVETGRRLWSTPCGEGYVAPPDVFVADGLVWVGTNRRLGNVYREPEFTEGLDPLTGEVRRRLDTSLAFLDRPHHHRCYRNKATDRFLVTGRHGVEMIPLDGDRPLLNDWVRGACRYGVLPCNGLLYLPPHACSCHISQMLGHFRALAAGSKAESGKRKAEQEQVVRLQKGPAYGRNIHHSSFSIHHSADWPTYRHDAARSGSTRTAVPTVLEQAWETDLPGKPTGLTAADGKVFVAVPDAHAVYALDAVAGGVLWRFTAGGRVDSPPTVARELALFGSADGSVYCLRASSGELVWRFQAAPRDFRTVVDNRVESVWPVHGSVLVHDGSVYATAGRSSNLDGGIRVYQLEVGTGRTLSQTVLKARGGTVQGRQQGPSDLLTADDHYVYLRFQPFPLADLNATASQTAARGEKADESSRLICPTGFLDDTWWHRSFWAFGKSKVFGDPRTVGTRAPAGQIMVFDDQAVYGYGRKPEYFMWTTPVEFRLFAADRQAMILPLELKQKQPQQSWLKHPERQFATRWSREVPLHVRAMVLADQTLFIAGPPSIAKEGPPETSASTSRLSPAQAGQSLDAWEGKSGARLWAVSTEDGSRLTEYALDCLPTWDGMAAAGGRLYLSTTDGTVVCLAANE